MEPKTALIAAINNTLFNKPLPDGFNNTDFNKLYDLAASHSCVNIVSDCLIHNNLVDGELYNKCKKSAKYFRLKYLFQENEYTELLKQFEEHQIPHALLKGSVLRYMYPRPDYRTSTDIDFFIPKKFDEAEEIIYDCGYSYHATEEKTSVKSYTKKGGMTVELHKHIVDKDILIGNLSYIETSFVQKPGKNYELMLSDEDFYVYMVAHIAKHFLVSGSGVRFILDVFVYLNSKNDTLDWSYINRKLCNINLEKFNTEIIKIAGYWFGGGPDFNRRKNLEDYIIGCGLYGNEKNYEIIRITSNNKSKGKTKYIFQRLFPNFSTMSKRFPILKKAPVLLPFLWVIRLVIFVFDRNAQLQARNVTSLQNNEISDVDEIMKQLGLN